MSKPPHAPPHQLYKQQSWSPDVLREEAWERRKVNKVTGGRHRPSKSLSEDDLQELKACIELGFGFDSPELDPKLSSTIPALEFYHAVNKQYNHSLSRSSSSSSLAVDGDAGSSGTLIDPGDDLSARKTKLRQWAQVVACAVRQSSSSCHN
ncbi:uncharacterized protein LOC129293641 [Prosopis cineraria]|uniref:uncharacterized protein LOC129293641 n=1 Tax=Prosopis cineraria TaxID=364024 RepID=UPI00240F1F97|nr:uncharacterized protein LOC129293641 [Prosopis cineraria]XP_054787683.1 uncharacterized protein LOC129293641 [Prosopis cineraria]XP_054787684.1 uncharacterized protein LOC129293641 [Prosopis cineraria]